MPVLLDTVLLVGAGSDFFLVVERVRDGARSGPEGDSTSTSTTISSLPFAVRLELSVLFERSSTNASSSLVSSELCRLDDPCRLHSDTDSGRPCRDMELKSDCPEPWRLGAAYFAAREPAVWYLKGSLEGSSWKLVGRDVEIVDFGRGREPDGGGKYPI